MNKRNRILKNGFKNGNILPEENLRLNEKYSRMNELLAES